jgi:hypothetical protein
VPRVFFFCLFSEQQRAVYTRSRPALVKRERSELGGHSEIGCAGLTRDSTLPLASYTD